MVSPLLLLPLVRRQLESQRRSGIHERSKCDRFIEHEWDIYTRRGASIPCGGADCGQDWRGSVEFWRSSARLAF